MPLWGISLPKDKFLELFEKEKGPWPTGEISNYDFGCKYGYGMPVDSPNKGKVLSISGGGGKTTSLYAIAGQLKKTDKTVLITTTTAIYNPLFENRSTDRVITGTIENILFTPPKKGTITIAAKKILKNSGKLKGFTPNQIDEIKKSQQYDIILVEADGSKGLPIKAPDVHEPLVPPCTDIACGIIGLDCLDKPLNENIVHRPNLFSNLTKLCWGHKISEKEIAVLCNAKYGVFKNAPDKAAKIVILNKADSKEIQIKAKKIADLIFMMNNREIKIDKVIICSMKHNKILYALNNPIQQAITK